MRWKRLIVIAARVIAALMVTGYAILLNYDFNKFKPRIAQAVKEATGRTLILDGDIEIDFGFPPRIVAESLSFGNAPWGSRPELASVKRLEVQIALLPLIRGIIDFKQVILVEPDFLLETNNSGQSNLEFETADEEESTIPVLIFDEVRIDKGLFTYKDGQSGETYVVKINRLTGAAPGYLESIELEQDCAFRDKRFEIKGTFGGVETLIDANKSWPVQLSAGHEGATLEVEGYIKDIVNFKNLVLRATVHGPSIPEFIAVTGITGVPDTGSFRLKAILTDPHGKLSIENISLEAGSRELAEVTIKGGIEDLLTFKGVNLDFMVQGENLTNLQKLGAPPLYIQKAFMVSGRISNPAEKDYWISDLKAFLGQNEVEGRIDLNFTRKRLQLTASLASHKTVLGPFKLALNVSGPADKLAIEKLDLNLGTESLESVFYSLDVDKDGKVTREELCAYYTDTVVCSERFHFYDQNDDDKLSLEEFVGLADKPESVFVKIIILPKNWTE